MCTRTAVPRGTPGETKAQRGEGPKDGQEWGRPGEGAAGAASGSTCSTGGSSEDGESGGGPLGWDGMDKLQGDNSPTQPWVKLCPRGLKEALSHTVPRKKQTSSAG